MAVWARFCRNADGAGVCWVLGVIRTTAWCFLEQDMSERRGQNKEYQGAVGKRQRADKGTAFMHKHLDIVLDGQEDRGTRPEKCCY